MFYIVNCSGRHVSLGSIGVMLAPRQGIDLDVKFPRHQTERCVELKNAISKGIVKLVRKDGNSKPSTQVKTDTNNTELLMHIKKMLEEAKSQNIDAIANAVAAKIGSSPVGLAASTIPVTNESGSGVVDVDMDSATLDVIHQRAVERMTKDIQGQSPPDQKTSVDINIGNKLDELEGLL